MEEYRYHIWRDGLHAVRMGLLAICLLIVIGTSVFVEQKCSLCTSQLIAPACLSRNDAFREKQPSCMQARCICVVC